VTECHAKQVGLALEHLVFQTLFIWCASSHMQTCCVCGLYIFKLHCSTADQILKLMYLYAVCDGGGGDDDDDDGVLIMGSGQL
jgi:hypothetical protein